MLNKKIACFSLTACLLVGCGASAPQGISVDVPTTEETDINIGTIFSETAASAAAANPWHEVTHDEFNAVFGSNLPGSDEVEEYDLVYRICDGDVLLGEMTFTYLDGSRHATFRVMPVADQDISGVYYDDWYEDKTTMGVRWRRRQDDNGMMYLTTWPLKKFGYSYSLLVEGAELDDRDDAIAFTFALYTANTGAAGPGNWSDPTADYEAD